MTYSVLIRQRKTMSVETEFSYNILINFACNLGLKSEAYQIVTEMKKNGLTPDSVTWRILS